MLVSLIEAPFLEPSMPRPSVFVAAEIFRQAGHEAVSIDLGARLYQHLLATPVSEFDKNTTLRKSFAKAFFLDELPPGQTNFTSQCRCEEVTLAAAACGDRVKLEILRKQAVARMGGHSPFIGHDQYVADQQLLNALLDHNLNRYGAGGMLTLEGTSPEWRGLFAQTASISRPWSGDSPIARLCEEAAKDLVNSSYDLVVVNVDSSQQLLPALLVSAWLKGYHPGRVMLAGKIIAVLSRAGLLVDMEEGSVYAGSAPSLAAKFTGLGIPSISCATANPGDGSGYLTPLPMATVQASCGCYWSRCTFCSVPFGEGAYTQARRNLFSRTIQELAGKGTKILQFLDYAMPYPHLAELSTLVDNPIKWSGQVRFEPFLLKDPGLLDNLGRSGCVSLSFGLETGSPQLLQSMQKGGLIDVASRKRVLKASAEAGIKNHLFVITGFPGESDDDFMKTVSFLDDARKWIHSVEIYPFQLQVGSPVWRAPHLYGVSMEDPSHSDSLYLNYNAKPPVALAQARAEVLTELFGSLSAENRMNDWLEGHLSMRGYCDD